MIRVINRPPTLRSSYYGNVDIAKIEFVESTEKGVVTKTDGSEEIINADQFESYKSDWSLYVKARHRRFYREAGVVDFLRTMVYNWLFANNPFLFSFKAVSLATTLMGLIWAVSFIVSLIQIPAAVLSIFLAWTVFAGGVGAFTLFIGFLKEVG